MDKCGRLWVCSAFVGVSTSLSPQLGERFAGRYELKSPLRTDGAVRAFLALDHHTGLDVALLLFDPACAHPNAWGTFARIVEAATAGKIAGLVLPQGVGSTPPVAPFCLAEPQALRGFDRLRDQGPVPWQRALTLGERAAEILHAAHAATGVAHRALTPSRCAVTVRDDVRVLDFGVAELELGRPDETGYRAPEQQQGGGDARSDAYTLAVILFELISGKKSAGKTPPRLRSLVAVPRPVDEFMARALSPDPAQRPADLAAMRAAIRELLGGGVAPAGPTNAAPPSPGSEPGGSPVSIISAPPGASVPPSVATSTRPAPAVGAAPAPANVAPAQAPVRPSAPAAAPSAAPLLPGRRVVSPRASPATGPRGGSSALPDLDMTPGAGPIVHNLGDTTEKLETPRRPTPVVADRTEILAGVSRPTQEVADRTEILTAVSGPRPVEPERTEVARPDVAIAREEEKTAPRKPLRGPLMALALSRAKAGAADPAATRLAAAGDEPPTEKIVKPLLPADTTLLLPPEPARPEPVEPRPAAELRPPEPANLGPVGVQPVAEARLVPSADSEGATTVFIPARAPASSKSAEDPFKKVLIWINLVCFSVLLLVLLWMLVS